MQTFRDRQIIQHLPLVDRLVRRLSHRIPSHMDKDALTGAGMEGLVKAVDAYDPKHGLALEQYASLRIRGALRDELRKQDPLSRKQRAQVRALDCARGELEHELGRSVADHEAAHRAELSQDALHESRSSAVFVEFSSIMEETVEGDSPAVESLVANRAELERVFAALDRRPEREQLAVSLYYIEDLNLDEVGQILGVSASRVSQLLRRARAEVRRVLEDEENEVCDMPMAA